MKAAEKAQLTELIAGITQAGFTRQDILELVVESVNMQPKEIVILASKLVDSAVEKMAIAEETITNQDVVLMFKLRNMTSRKQKDTKPRDSTPKESKTETNSNQDKKRGRPKKEQPENQSE